MQLGYFDYITIKMKLWWAACQSRKIVHSYQWCVRATLIFFQFRDKNLNDVEQCPYYTCFPVKEDLSLVLDFSAKSLIII